MNDERLLVGLRVPAAGETVESAETRLLAVNRDGTQQISNLFKKNPQEPAADSVETIAQDPLAAAPSAAVDYDSRGHGDSTVMVSTLDEPEGAALPVRPVHHLPQLDIAEAGKEDECVTRLARVGLDKIVGYVDGGFDAWKNAGENTDMIITIEADELAMDIPFDDKLLIVDVRKENEFEEGHIVDALNLPLSDLTDIASIASLEEEQNLYVHCAGGYRSVIACSLLKRQGLHNIRNIAGGWEKIKQEEKIKTEKSEKKPAVDKDQLN